MRLAAGLIFALALASMASLTAQPPEGKGPPKGKKGDKGPGGPGGNGKSATVEEMVARMMALDKNGDGQLSKDEVADERLHNLFTEADVNKDGVLTKDELTAWFTKANADSGGGKGGPGGPKGDKGGPPPKKPKD
jgi:hypothetical protein